MDQMNQVMFVSAGATPRSSTPLNNNIYRTRIATVAPGQIDQKKNQRELFNDKAENKSKHKIKIIHKQQLKMPMTRENQQPELSYMRQDTVSQESNLMGETARFGGALVKLSPFLNQELKANLFEPLEQTKKQFQSPTKMLNETVSERFCLSDIKKIPALNMPYDSKIGSPKRAVQSRLHAQATQLTQNNILPQALLAQDVKYNIQKSFTQSNSRDKLNSKPGESKNFQVINQNNITNFANGAYQTQQNSPKKLNNNNNKHIIITDQSIQDHQIAQQLQQQHDSYEQGRTDQLQTRLVFNSYPRAQKTETNETKQSLLNNTIYRLNLQKCNNPETLLSLPSAARSFSPKRIKVLPVKKDGRFFDFATMKEKPNRSLSPRSY